MDAAEIKYLELLSSSFPSASAAAGEIINLNAILNLPKGTEMFASDIHGEYTAFTHLLRNGSGAVCRKIDDAFAEQLTPEEKRSLATLIYYPREKMEIELAKAEDPDKWCSKAILNLSAVCKQAAGKYTRSHVRKVLPPEFAYIIEELISESNRAVVKKPYFRAIVKAIIEAGQAEALIESMSMLVKRLTIDHLHVVGDVYDRGPDPDKIMDVLMRFHSVDVQWGNHDVVWMGAALGQRGCIAHVVRNCARYGNLGVLEDAYGINLRPLASFAMEAYADDPCVGFALKDDAGLTPAQVEMNMKIQKAMAILQFKVEAAIIAENPEFGLEDRNLLDKVDLERGVVLVDGVEYTLTDAVFPTVDWSDPYRLTPEEEEVVEGLSAAFMGSEKLQRHMRFFLDVGSLCKVSNGNLLFHAGVPLNADGSLMEVDVFGEKLAGRALYEALERHVRNAFDSPDAEERRRGRDILWWLWLAPGSPLFAKSKMATFEIYLCAEKEARKEVKNPFYSLLDDERAMGVIFEDFGLDPATSRIVCGHVPVKVKDGEDPVKCGGRVLAIDGGFSKAYQKVTGIAGITLLSSSRGLKLLTHEPLESVAAAVEGELDIDSTKRVIELYESRRLVADTDTGAEMKRRIADLELLLEAYRLGLIPEGE